MKKNRLLLQFTSVALLLCLLLSGCFIPLPDSTEPPVTDSGIQTIVPDTTVTDTTFAEPPDTQDEPIDTTVPVTEAPVEATTEPPAETPTEETTQAPTEEATEPPTEKPTEPPTEPPTEKPTEPPAAASGFTVYFLDVGQADSALIVCDGKTMLIDGGNAADSNLIYSVLKKRGVTHLDYIIATHAHEDHAGGLPGALQYATVGTVYCPVTSYSSKSFNNFVSAVQKQGKQITVPSVGTSFNLGSAKVTLLAVNTLSDANNTSIVARIVYGNTSFLFTGDAEREVEQVLINRGVNLRSTVLKVGHHGSYTSTSYAFLWNVMPQYAVISCGKGNSYGHPHDEVLSRLHDADVFTFRTDLQGDITCTSNGSTVKFRVDRNWNADVFGSLGGNTSQETTLPPETEPVTTTPDPVVTEPDTTVETTEPEPTVTQSIIDYILNANSMKFHDPNCEWAQKISDRNRIDYIGSREELIERGYSPCGSCQP